MNLNPGIIRFNLNSTEIVISQSIVLLTARLALVQRQLLCVVTLKIAIVFL